VNYLSVFADCSVIRFILVVVLDCWKKREFTSFLWIGFFRRVGGNSLLWTVAGIRRVVVN
jgi:hypothetical protein